MTESPDSRHGHVWLAYHEHRNRVRAEFLWSGSATHPPKYKLHVGSFVTLQLDREVPARLLSVSVAANELSTVGDGFLQQFIGQQLVNDLQATVHDKQPHLVSAELTLENRLAIARRQVDDPRTPAPLQDACCHMLKSYLNPDNPQP